MSRQPEFDVCSHEWIGTVHAGNPEGPYCSVVVCVLPKCIAAARRHVHAATGKPASDVITFAEHRKARA